MSMSRGNHEPSHRGDRIGGLETGVLLSASPQFCCTSARSLLSAYREYGLSALNLRFESAPSVVVRLEVPLLPSDEEASVTRRISSGRIRFAQQLRVADPEISGWIVGAVYVGAIVLPGRLGIFATRVMLGLVAVGVVSVFLRLATSVPSRGKRAAAALALAAGFFLLAFEADGWPELLGVALALLLGLLGSDQLVTWSRIRPRPKNASSAAAKDAHAGYPKPERVAPIGSAQTDAQPQGVSHVRSERWKGKTRTPERDAREAYEVGLRLEQGRDLIGAEAAFRRADKWGHPAGGYRLGRLLEERGDRTAARVAYRHSSRLGDADGAASLARLLEENAAASARIRLPAAKRTRPTPSEPAQPQSPAVNSQAPAAHPKPDLGSPKAQPRAVESAASAVPPPAKTAGGRPTSHAAAPRGGWGPGLIFSLLMARIWRSRGVNAAESCPAHGGHRVIEG